MRIAFVGKGGSGKTTLCVLFAEYARSQSANVLVVDADINMHVPSLIGVEAFPIEKHLSAPLASHAIRRHLAGSNKRISVEAFRKTTPPGFGSSLIFLEEKDDPILSTYAVTQDGLRLLVVGTYHEDDIGTSCYHNHLATFENILTHLVDDRGILVVDMVAGVDAFASTLHAQFDLTVLAVEPTRRSVEVYQQYAELARNAGCVDSLKVVGNKIRTEEDAQFVRQHIPSGVLLGFIGDSAYLRAQDRTQGVLDVYRLEDTDRQTVDCLYRTLSVQPFRPQERLKKIQDLHRRYVAQASIRDRFGDLTTQIDEPFDLPTVIREHRRDSYGA